LQREILPVLVSLYSLKWLYTRIFSANILHSKLTQPSLKRTASDCRRPEYLLTFLVSGSLIFKCQEDEEDYVRSCSMTLRTEDDTPIWRRKL